MVERLVDGTCARYIFDILSKMIATTISTTDAAEMNKNGLDPANLADVKYCHLVQVQTTIGDLNLLILKASKIYTTTITKPFDFIDEFKEMIEVGKVTAYFSQKLFPFVLLLSFQLLNF